MAFKAHLITFQLLLPRVESCKQAVVQGISGPVLSYCDEGLDGLTFHLLALNDIGLKTMTDVRLGRSD